MYKISNNLSPIFIKDIVAESRIPCNTRSTVKVEKESNGDLKCTKKSDFELLVIETFSCGLQSIRYLRSYDLEASTADKLKEMTPLIFF